MMNCFTCKINDECDCGKMVKGLEEYLPYGLYDQIRDMFMNQFDCEYGEQ